MKIKKILQAIKDKAIKSDVHEGKLLRAAYALIVAHIECQDNHLENSTLLLAEAVDMTEAVALEILGEIMSEDLATPLISPTRKHQN